MNSNFFPRFFISFLCFFHILFWFFTSAFPHSTNLISLGFPIQKHIFIKHFRTSNKLKFNLFLQLLSIYILIYQSIKYSASPLNSFLFFFVPFIFICYFSQFQLKTTGGVSQLKKFLVFLFYLFAQ